MPLIAINLSDKLLQDIRDLVDKGRYASFESFIEIGAFNQLALERGSTPAEIIERGHRRGPLHTPLHGTASPPLVARTAVPKPPPRNGTKRSVTTDKVSKVDVIAPVTDDEAKAVFGRLARLDKGSEGTALAMPKNLTPGERIFGQVNRLFPVKLVCRWLASAAATEGQWPKFTAIAPKLSDDAGTIGSLLDDWDKSHNRERGGELATALPRRKNAASVDRFLSQFVARITRASEVSPGAVCQYEFARFEDSALALTEQGTAFAGLENPILDAHDKKASTALSLPEATFLAEHIRVWVPTEWEDMRVVLAAVQEGKASPTEVAVAVREKLPADWTDSMVQTHISGVIARLGDIRLLRRSWQGRNVRYELGQADTVNKFLSIDTEGKL